MILGIDVSRWQQKVDWELLKSKGIQFAFIKATQGNYLVDPMLKTHLNNAKKHGMIVGVYHWCDPMVPNEGQAKFFLEAIKGLDYSFAVADVEQNWTDWAEWRNKKITKIIPALKISENARIILEYWKKHIDKTLVVYTRASFINYYAAVASSWLPKYHLWLAHYVTKMNKANITWDAFKNYIPREGGPSLPRNCNKWTFWQFTGGRFILEGVDTSIDLNIFNGDLDDLVKLAGSKKIETSKPETPVELTLEERVARLEKLAEENGWQL